MALLFDQTCSFPSFRESALRSSVDQTSEKPLIFSASLLYPDTAKRALALRRRPNAHFHKVTKAPAKMAHLLCLEPASARLLPSPPVSPTAKANFSPIPMPIEPTPTTMQFNTSPLVPAPALAPAPAPAPASAQVQAPMALQHLSPIMVSLPSPDTPPRCAVEPIKVCISCKSSQSPCWRPSWDPEAGQLCNSCGLRYKKTGARCLNYTCGKIPSKGEWSTMKRSAVQTVNGEPQYSCLACNTPVELRN